MTEDSDEVLYGDHDEVQHWICEHTDLPFFAKDPQNCPHCGSDDLPYADGHYRPIPSEVYYVNNIIDGETSSTVKDDSQSLANGGEPPKNKNQDPETQVQEQKTDEDLVLDGKTKTLPTAAEVSDPDTEDGHIAKLEINPVLRILFAGDELVRRQDVSEWLTRKEEEMLNREHGKISYQDEGVVKAVFDILRKELVGEDPDLFHEKTDVTLKEAEGDSK